jgi:hypothetical protein
VRADAGAPPLEEGQARPGSSIRQAMIHVENIRNDLRQVIEELHLVNRILDQAEREKTASEEEIEKLRDALRGLHREQPMARGGRDYSPRPMAPEPSPAVDEPPQAEEPGDDAD